MCGIAGLIHRGKSSNVGEELQHMLQALKHRGPDSTGYALYANNDGQNFILRFGKYFLIINNPVNSPDAPAGG